MCVYIRSFECINEIYLCMYVCTYVPACLCVCVCRCLSEYIFKTKQRWLKIKVNQSNCNYGLSHTNAKYFFDRFNQNMWSNPKCSSRADHPHFYVRMHWLVPLLVCLFGYSFVYLYVWFCFKLLLSIYTILYIYVI